MSAAKAVKIVASLLLVGGVVVFIAAPSDTVAAVTFAGFVLFVVGRFME